MSIVRIGYRIQNWYRIIDCTCLLLSYIHVVVENRSAIEAITNIYPTMWAHVMWMQLVCLVVRFCDCEYTNSNAQPCTSPTTICTLYTMNYYAHKFPQLAMYLCQSAWVGAIGDITKEYAKQWSKNMETITYVFIYRERCTQFTSFASVVCLRFCVGRQNDKKKQLSC